MQKKTVNGGSKLLYKKYCTVKLYAENPMLSIISVSVSVKIKKIFKIKCQNQGSQFSLQNQCTKIMNNAQLKVEKQSQ